MRGSNDFKSVTERPDGQARKNGNKNRVPMYSIEHIQNELDKVFIECGYKVGEAPFEDGDWREAGAAGEMITKYCQKLNVNCHVHHGRNLLTYMAPEDNKAGMAIVNVSIWGDHVYFLWIRRGWHVRNESDNFNRS